MYADRDRRGSISPASLAAAVAINGGLVAALMLSAPEVFAPPERTITAYPIDADPPPPPPPPPRDTPPARADTPTSRPIPDMPIPKVDVLVPPPPDLPIGGTGPVAPPGDGGAGDVGPALDPPKPPPVLVEASPDPRYARDFQPDYPPSERRAGTEGRVTVRILVGTDGRVKAVERVSAASDAFFDATRRQALSRWRFRPATRDGVPQESWRTMSVRFVMEG